MSPNAAPRVLILASTSRYRAALLERFGVPFSSCYPRVDEAEIAGEPPRERAVRLAAAKAEAVWAAVAGSQPVLGADTAVVLDGEILGKPETAAEAAAMLERLSGRAHRVLTAVAVRHAGGLETRLSDSEVRFRATTAAERLAYCATEEPFDKAGGYGIQGYAAVFVEELKGSYSGVVGLPLFETAALLTRCGIPVWLTAQAA